METTTPFDLNQAIRTWRENLGQSPAFRRENLDELEAHLRDSIDSLQTHELSPEEALIVASKRAGTSGALESEFAKVNAPAVWFDRVLWMVVGLQCWMIAATAFMPIFLLTQLPAKATHDLLQALGVQTFERVGIQFAAPLLFVVAALIVWGISRRPIGWLRDGLVQLVRRPVIFAMTFLAIVILLQITFSFLTLWISPGQFGRRSGFDEMLTQLPQFLTCSLVSWFVARNRLRLSQA